MREVRLGLMLAWIVASLITISTVVAPYALTEHQIAGLVPSCERKVRSGRDCFFCGMTTGFLAIAGGRFQEAEHSNRAAIPLYSGFVLNGVALTFALLRGGLGVKEC